MAKKTQKIVFVLPRLNEKGGQERSTLEIVRRLPAEDWSVHVLSFVCEGAPINVQWQRVPGHWLPSQLVRNLWFQIYSWLMLKSRFQEALVVTVGVASWRADVRVIQFFHTRLAALVDEKKAVLPKAHSLFRVGYQKLFSAWNCWLEKKLLPEASQLIAISQAVASDLVLAGCDSKKITVIHHAPEISSTDTLSAKELAVSSDDKPPLLLFVGALERKGVEKCLRCLSQLTDITWELAVIGEGDLKRWREFAQEKGVAERVAFHGYQPSKAWFEKADVFIFPSLYEPFGLVVSEAVSNELAIIASLECGAMELWSDREDWLRLSANDSDERWISALRRVLSDPLEMQRVAREAKKSFLNWDWDQAANKYIEVFANEEKENSSI